MTSEGPAGQAGQPAVEHPAAATGFGHGKVILLGEHTVVYGHPAVAAGLPEPFGVKAQLFPGTGQITAPGWDFSARVGDESPVGTALSRLFSSLGLTAQANGAWPWDLTLEAQIPPGGGLGSSAAMAVAVARAVSRLRPVSDEDLTRAVAAAETVFHGTPSGVDAAAARGAGIGLYTKTQGWQPARVRQPIKLCVGLSAETRSTADMVAQVAQLTRRSPSARRVVDTLAEITTAGIEALGAGDIDELGRQFDLAHGLLAGLRLSTPKLDALVHAARAAGALGAKLTGAGGGGAVIALAPSHRQDVLDRWRAAGFEGFVVSVG